MTTPTIKFRSDSELSNFWVLDSPMMFHDKFYPTSEHAFQASKFLWEGASAACQEYAEEIRNAKSPSIAKLLGGQRNVSKYKWQDSVSQIITKYRLLGVSLDPEWESHKNDIMFEILMEKFKNRRCQKVLLSTIGHDLAEDSKFDNYWGIGASGNGENHLGKLLVQVRQIIFY